MDRNAERIGCKARDRVQIFHRIIERPALEQGLVDQGLGAPEQNRVPIRFCPCDRGRADGRASPTHVLDDDSAEQGLYPICPGTTHSVKRSPRRERNDELYWPRWVGLS